MHTWKSVGENRSRGPIAVDRSIFKKSTGLAIFIIVAVQMVIAQGQNAENANSSGVAQSDASTAEETYKPPKIPFSVSWDTTFKYSPIFRVAKQSIELSAPVTPNNNNINQNDGDLNFHRGLVSNRVDVFSELDVNFNGNYGVRASTAAWANPIYNQHTANALAPHFPEGTKDLEFRKVELMDAFFHGKTDWAGGALTFKGGQFAQVWGQTLFMGYNGIAGGMAPSDIIKANSEPNVEFKELIRPVPQVTAQWQRHNLSIGAYYQFEFQPSRLPTVGSYFSNADVIGDGAEYFYMGPTTPPLTLAKDVWAKDWDQYGAQVLIKLPHEFDLGFYGIVFHDKGPQLVLEGALVPNESGPPSVTFPYFARVYQEGIKSLGVSVTKTQGVINWALEVSGRINQDLAVPSSVTMAPPGFSPSARNAPYPVGDTIHANLSAFASNMKPNKLARESSLLVEVAYNNVLSVTKNRALWESSGSNKPGALALQALYTLSYDQVRPNLNLDIPLGLTFDPIGKSALGPVGNFAAYHGGTVNFGLTATYRDKNKFGITYQRYVGDQMGAIASNPTPHYSYGQSLGDRNYIALSINRSFGVRASKKSH